MADRDRALVDERTWFADFGIDGARPALGPQTMLLDGRLFPADTDDPETWLGALPGTDPVAEGATIARQVQQQLKAQDLEKWCRRAAQDVRRTEWFRLVSAMEAAALVQVDGADEIVLAVLDDRTEVDDRAREYAAWRCRHLRFGTDARRRKTWTHLQRFLNDRLEQGTVAVAAALPSAAHVGGVEAVPWLVGHLTRRDLASRLVLGIAWALLDLATKSTAARAGLPPDDADRVVDVVLDRFPTLDRSSVDDCNFGIACLWLVGYAATARRLDAVASLLVREFVSGHSALGPAALQGARGLVAWQPAAVGAMLGKFDDRTAASRDRFFRLLAARDRAARPPV